MTKKIILDDLVEKSFLINKKRTLDILKFGFLHPDCQSICYNGLYNIIFQSEKEFKKIKNQNDLNLFGK